MQTPYPGPSAPVLSADGTLRVEASNYDAGGEGVSWHDTTSGIVGNGASDGGRTGSDVEQADGAIVWISDGEWLEYTIDVAVAGRYELDVSTASTQNGQGLDFEVFRAGEGAAYASSDRISAPNTGSWQSYQTSTAALDLEAGPQVVRVNFTGGINFRDFTLEAGEAAPEPEPTPSDGQTPYPGPSAPVLSAEGTLRVGASSYNSGGEGVSWHDATSGIVGNGATDGGRSGSDVETTPAGDIGWVQDGEWLEYTIDVAEAGSYDLGLLMGTKNNGRSVEVSFTRAGDETAYRSVNVETRNTGSYASFAENEAQGIALEAGRQTVRIAFEGKDQDFRAFTLEAGEAAPEPEPTPSDGQTPYPGPSAPVLSADGTLRVEASNYDAGGEGVSWHDTTSGIVGNGASDGGRTGSDVEQADGAIVWISDGEWLEYTIDVAVAGRYELDVSTASTQNGQGLDFEVFRAGEGAAYASSDRISAPNTGSWQSYQTSTAALDLEAGTQVVRVNFTGGINFRDFTLEAGEAAPEPEPTPSDGQTPYPGPSAPVLSAEGTLRVGASSYDSGGEGVSWHDATSGIVGNGATDGGRSGSDVETTPAGDIGWVQDGEWLEYTIDVAEAGSYDLGLLMGTKNNGRSVEVSFTRAGDETAYRSVNVETRNTGSYASFAENEAQGIALEAGRQTVRIAFEGKDQDFRAFTLEAGEAAPEPEPTPSDGQTPYPGPSAPVLSADGTLRVEASNYDAGGEGVSWHDTTSGIVGNGASDGGRTGSDVEQADGAIVWISDGEWLEYTIDVAVAGRYELDVSTASTQNGQGLDFEVFRAGEGAAYASSDRISAPNTGSWQSYQTSTAALDLEAGTQVVRVNFTGGINFRDFTLEAGDPDALSYLSSDRAIIVDLAADHMIEAARILPLGDSITYGEDTPGGYRAMLWHELVDESGLWFDFVGAYTGNPGPGLHDLDHQGKSGIQARTVAGTIDDIASDTPSDIALILLGANDVPRGAWATNNVPGWLQTIVETLDASNPGMEILLSELTPWTEPTYQTRVEQVNAALPGLVAHLKSEGINVSLVDMSSITTDDLKDRVHPNDNGYALMAQNWIDALLANATVTGTTFNGTAEKIDPTITAVRGSESGDQLLGDNSANRLDGGGGNDQLVGRGGNDVLIGGTGRDNFIFGADFGDDEIIDFDAGSGGDVLTFAGLGVSSFSDLSSYYIELGAGTTFSFGSEETLLLANVAFSTLDAGNFMFPGDNVA